MKPVYWKPRYPSRVTRERVWAKRSAAREQALAQSRPPSRLRDFLRRLRVWVHD
ncbi:MAG TPA: hypothetical protein VF101_13685 [Gaiellaceae bacterium]